MSNVMSYINAINVNKTNFNVININKTLYCVLFIFPVIYFQSWSLNTEEFLGACWKVGLSQWVPPGVSGSLDHS